MEDLYRNLSSYSPAAIIAFLVLASGFLLRIIIQYTTVIYRAKEVKNALAGPFSIFKGREEAALKAAGDKLPLPPGRIKSGWHALMVFLHIRKDDAETSLSFNRALEVLEKHLGHKDYQYKLPWFLLLGATESGKSHILEDVELDLPLGHPEYEHETERPPLKWWFFDRAVVIDVIGDYLIYKAGTDNNEGGWSALLSLLRKYRVRRPLDGIILTIPADEIYGNNKLSHDELIARAKFIHTKLWSIQQTLAMRIPVYLVITKTDLVPGFTEFSNELPLTSLKEMLGWSSPYSLGTPFDPSWVDDAYDSLRASLQLVRCEIFHEGTNEQDTDGAFIFSVELEKTRAQLTTYLTHIFKESAFAESLFPRGIYFTGDVGMHTAMGDHRRSDRYWTPPEALGAAMETPFQEHDKYQIAFATDLFEKKIFPESTLARPINRILRSTSKTLNFAKVAVAAVAIVWCVGLFKENKNLSAGKDQVLGLVQEVDQTMHNMNRREFSDSNIDDAKYLNEQTIKILNKMAGINVTRSFSIFIPSSWLSGYDDRLEKATALAWNDIVLRSIFSGLQEKARKLFLPLVEKEADNNEINPVKKVSFLTLNQFVIDSNLFEHNVSIYNDLEKSENIEDVGRLVRYLYGVDLPATFYENSFYYQNALGQTKGGDISVTDYATPAQRKLQLLYDRFLETIFDPLTSAVNMPLLTSAMDGLINLASDREMDQVKLYKNIEITLSMAKIISDPDMKWIEGKDFNPSPVFSDFLNNVVNSRIMGVKMNRLLRDSVQAGFVKYKAALKDLSVPLIGIIFASKDGAVLAQPSINYQELVKNLGNLLQQPFMVNLPVVQSISPIPPGRLLFWDESTLARAGKMVDTYDTYVAEQLPLLSEDLRRVLRSIGRFNLTKHVFNNVAKAETFRTQPQSITGFDEQEALQQQVQNLKLSQPYFDKILGQSMTGTLSMQESRLRDLLGDYAYGILTRIDNILVREDLYGLGDDKLNWWQGVDMLGLRAFGVYDLDDMKSYLAAQKDRINLLGKDLAAPVLNFLNTNFLRSLNRNGPLKEKWTRIVLQLDASDKKIPGNSVSVLEHFLQYDLNQVGYDSCYELVDAADHLSQTGDFFLDRRNRIRSAMVDRCKYLLQTKGVEAYNKLAHFFNMYLSGRFPFTASNAEETAGIEAMAADVEVFLSMFDALGSVERQTIETYFENTGSSHSPGQFLQQIEMIRPLLQASLDGNMNMHLPKLDLEVAFRTDRNRESGGDKIIDWAIAIDGKTVDFWDQKHVGEWHVGEDVVVDLQWAADGFVSPLNDSANPNLQVIGNTARFVYKGRWSLVRLIKAHATDVVKFSHATPIVLQFNVPTTHTPPKGHPELEGLRDDLARVYLSLNISLPAKAIPNGEKAVADTKGAAPTKGTPAPAPVPLADKPKSKPLSAPMFPVSAPVLTKGQVVR